MFEYILNENGIYNRLVPVLLLLVDSKPLLVRVVISPSMNTPPWAFSLVRAYGFLEESLVSKSYFLLGKKMGKKRVVFRVFFQRGRCVEGRTDNVVRGRAGACCLMNVFVRSWLGCILINDVPLVRRNYHSTNICYNNCSVGESSFQIEYLSFVCV